MKKLIFFFITVFIFGTSYAQNSVSGTVVDSEVGSGLPGASVVVKGTYHLLKIEKLLLQFQHLPQQKSKTGLVT